MGTNAIAARLSRAPDPTIDEQDLVAWAERVGILDKGGSVPELIVRLEQLRVSKLDTETRYRILRTVKRPLLEAVAKIPKVPRDHTGRTPMLSVEQRLYDAVTRNLERLLADLDRTQRGVGHQRSRTYHEERSQWVVRNLFRFTERKLFYALKVNGPWPVGVWQSLHDLFVYLVLRGNVRLRGETETAAPSDGFDAEQHYKRTLMIGLAADVLGRRRIDSQTRQLLGTLAEASRLVESDGLVGEYGLILVEVGQDAPARIKTDPLDDPFRGWVLQAPAAYRRLFPAFAAVDGEPLRHG